MHDGMVSLGVRIRRWNLSSNKKKWRLTLCQKGTRRERERSKLDERRERGKKRQGRHEMIETKAFYSCSKKAKHVIVSIDVDKGENENKFEKLRMAKKKFFDLITCNCLLKNIFSKLVS